MSSDEKDLQVALAATRQRRRRSNIGLFAGIGLGLMVGSLIPWVRENVDLFSLIVWSAILGVVVTNLNQFSKAGAILTRRENPLLNFIVGLGLPVLFFVALNWIIQRYF